MNRRLTAIFVTACLGLARVHPAAMATPGAQAMQAAQRLAKEALAAYRAADYTKAAQSYADALRSVEHEDLFFMYGRSLEQLGQFKSAALAYERAVALLPTGARRQTMAARAASNAKLDEAQQLLNDGQAVQALPMAQVAHTVLFGQSRRAEDGQVYAEPASVLLLLARLELATGNGAAAQSMLAEVRADPTAPDKVLERARQLAATAATRPQANMEPAGPPPVVVARPKPEGLKPEPPKAEPAKPPPVVVVVVPSKVVVAKPEPIKPPSVTVAPAAAEPAKTAGTKPQPTMPAPTVPAATVPVQPSAVTPAEPGRAKLVTRTPPPAVATAAPRHPQAIDYDDDDARPAPAPTPAFYERWWFWTATGAVVVGGVAAWTVASQPPNHLAPPSFNFQLRIP